MYLREVRKDQFLGSDRTARLRKRWGGGKLMTRFGAQIMDVPGEMGKKVQANTIEHAVINYVDPTGPTGQGKSVYDVDFEPKETDSLIDKRKLPSAQRGSAEECARNALFHPCFVNAYIVVYEEKPLRERENNSVTKALDILRRLKAMHGVTNKKKDR